MPLPAEIDTDSKYDSPGSKYNIRCMLNRPSYTYTYVFEVLFLITLMCAIMVNIFCLYTVFFNRKFSRGNKCKIIV